MAYQKTTIANIIEKISTNQLYLPAIQRKYVWTEAQITKLMDSILRGYPFGTFLFWKVKKETINQKNYSMYHFIKNYHERDHFRNEPAPQPFVINDGNPDNYVHAALDGQQRLTSLFIALQGSLSMKLPRRRWDNDGAFPERELYFDLHSHPTPDEETAYHFAFLTADKAKDMSNDILWYRVKDIVQYAKLTDATKWLVSQNLLEDERAVDNMTTLFDSIKSQELINYFEVETENIDDVLDIFVRVNSGGTVLSKTDLLFSTIVASWDKGREEIDNLLQEINRIGEHYFFSNDFIMRVCLYIMDMPISLKVENFGLTNVNKIQNAWEQIRQSIKDTITLLSELGFSAENIIAANAILPVIYYRYKYGVEAFTDKTTRMEIRKYLVISQLRRIFGQSANTALGTIRTELQKHKEKFQLAFLQQLAFAGGKALQITADDIDGWFDDFEKNAYTFMLLTLLYKDLKFSQNAFHQDHMHPYAAFEIGLKNLQLPNGQAMTDEKIKQWQHKRNTLANLQILEGRENSSKNATPLIVWLQDPANKQNVKYLPPNIDYSLENFDEFITERQKLMADKLKEILR